AARAVYAGMWRRRIEPRRARRSVDREARSDPDVRATTSEDARMYSRKRVSLLLLAGACGLLAVPGGSATAAHGTAPKPPSGYTLVPPAAVVAPAGQQVRGRVVCPPGLVPFSGSAAIHSATLLATVNGTFPLGTEWVADVNNAGATDVAFEVDA